MPILRAVAFFSLTVATALFAVPRAEALAPPGLLDFGDFVQELDQTFFALDELDEATTGSDLAAQAGKKLSGKKIDLDDAKYDTDICGARFDKVSTRNRAPNGVDKRQLGLVNDYMRQAKRYGNNVRAILVGDSIMEDLSDDRSCLREIFKRFGNKCFNWGISGIDVDFTKTLVNWLFSNSYPQMEPQVVFVAVGVNNCARGHDYNRVSRGIVDIIKLVKYYSPQTRVVVQGVLPSSHGTSKGNFEGKKFKDMELYDCIRKTNAVVERWIKRNHERCIEFEDLSSVVLSGGKFRKNILRDGLHFDEDRMGRYCEDIADAIKSFSGVQIKSSDANVFSNWTDVEPLHVPDVEGNETLFRWRYNEWSNCTGACGVQRRTAECHAVSVATGESYTVAESLCTDVFMNPVERVCNLEPACQAELGPLGALLRQPVSASGLLGRDLVVVENACDTPSTNNAVYIGVIAALAAALLGALVLVAVMKRSTAQREAATELMTVGEITGKAAEAVASMDKAGSSNISAVKV